MPTLHVKIDNDLARKIRALAALEDATIEDVVIQSVENFIKVYPGKNEVEQAIRSEK